MEECASRGGVGPSGAGAVLGRGPTAEGDVRKVLQHTCRIVRTYLVLSETVRIVCYGVVMILVMYDV